MDIDNITAKAAAKIDAARKAKVDAVRAVAASGVELAEAAQLLAAAEQKYAKDYQAAIRADWTESDLKSFGLDSPAKKVSGRPRGTKKARGDRAAADSQPAAEATENAA